MHFEIVNRSNNPNPEYQTEASAGMDIRAFLNDPIDIHPGEFKLISTGIHIKILPGFEIQVRPRSGLALKKGISVLNSPGTIDADYRGEIGVILINLSDSDFEINSGDRIAQMVISKHENISWKTVDKLDESKRGDKGFGSTGV